MVVTAGCGCCVGRTGVCTFSLARLARLCFFFFSSFLVLSCISCFLCGPSPCCLVHFLSPHANTAHGAEGCKRGAVVRSRLHPRWPARAELVCVAARAAAASARARATSVGERRCAPRLVRGHHAHMGQMLPSCPHHHPPRQVPRRMFLPCPRGPCRHTLRTWGGHRRGWGQRQRAGVFRSGSVRALLAAELTTSGPAPSRGGLTGGGSGHTLALSVRCRRLCRGTGYWPLLGLTSVWQDGSWGRAGTAAASEPQSPTPPLVLPAASRA